MNLRALHERGWDTLVIWECETRARGDLVERISSFLKVSGECPSKYMKYKGDFGN